MTRKHLITAKAGILGSQDVIPPSLIKPRGKHAFPNFVTGFRSQHMCTWIKSWRWVVPFPSFPIFEMWSTSLSVVSFLPLLKRWQIWQPSRRRHQLMLSPCQDVAAKPGDGTCAETADDRFPNFRQSAAWLNMFFWGYHSLKGKQMKWGGYQDKRQDKDAKMTSLATANCHNCHNCR